MSVLKSLSVVIEDVILHCDQDLSLTACNDCVASLFQKSSSNRRQPSGYIVFAGEIRKSIQNENPESSFGDISRIVGMKVSFSAVCTI